MDKKIQEADKSYSSLWSEGGETEEQGSTEDSYGDPERDFREHWGWYATLDEVVSQTQGVNEDMVLEWTFIRFLNRIAYLKHKNFTIKQVSQKNKNTL